MLLMQMMLAAPPHVEATGEAGFMTAEFVVKLCAGIAAIVTAFMLGRKKSMTVENNPLHVRKALDFVSKEEFAELETEVREGFATITDQFADERSIARTANGTIHKRIDKTQEMVSEVKGELKVLNSNVEKLLTLAMENKKK